MAFSSNLRSLRTVAMAVLVSSSFGLSAEPGMNEVSHKPLEKNDKRTVASGKSNNVSEAGARA